MTPTTRLGIVSNGPSETEPRAAAAPSRAQAQNQAHPSRWGFGAAIARIEPPVQETLAAELHLSLVARRRGRVLVGDLPRAVGFFPQYPRQPVVHRAQRLSLGRQSPVGRERADRGHVVPDLLADFVELDRDDVR